MPSDAMFSHHQQYYYPTPQSNLDGMMYSKPPPSLTHPASARSVDFELFGRTNAAPGLDSTAPAAIVVGRPSQASRSKAYNDLNPSNESAPVPDLIPDSPSSFSPPNSFPPPFSQYPAVSNIMRGNNLSEQQFVGVHRNERSASVPPLGDIPKPRRRRTQEWSEQESFVPSVLPNHHQQQQQQQHPQSFAASTFSGSTPSANSTGQGINNTASSSTGSFWTPSADHPLSIPEQQDLLDRVRRDLNGVDLDSIKGPLRALALSGGSSDVGSNTMLPGAFSTVPTSANSTGSRPISRPLNNARDEMERRTVSPQEAFLDYDDVDNRLHANPRLGSNISSSFGLGVGQSLFAPLPRPSSAQARPTSSPVVIPAPASTSPRPASPTIVPSTSPRHVSGGALFPRKPHPFAVPQNAVSWAERQASVDDSLPGTEDFERESSDGEDTDGLPEPAILAGNSMSGKKPTKSAAAALFGEDDDDDDEPSGIAATVAAPHEEVIGEFDEDQIQTQARARSRTPLPGAIPIRTAQSSTPVRPSTLGSSSVTATPSSPDVTTTERITDESLAIKASHPMRGSAVRALQALQQEVAAEEIIDDDADGDVDPLFEEDDEPFEPTASTSTRASGRRTTPSQRKRSRTPVLDDDDEDAEGSVGDASFHDSDSDAPTKRSTSGTVPNKRRRRVPTAASTTATSASSLRCTHVNPDGSTCGVVFRRPYDLARHRETIHGEGGKAGKKHDWICKQCGGSFSRKDALIRHGRIRNHKSGV